MFQSGQTGCSGIHNNSASLYTDCLHVLSTEAAVCFCSRYFHNNFSASRYRSPFPRSRLYSPSRVTRSYSGCPMTKIFLPPSAIREEKSCLIGLCKNRDLLCRTDVIDRKLQYVWNVVQERHHQSHAPAGSCGSARDARTDRTFSAEAVFSSDRKNDREHACAAQHKKMVEVTCVSLQSMISVISFQ